MTKEQKDATDRIYKGHTGAHQNPNGTWVCGGAHTGAHQNPYGTWVCGGAHTGAHQNPNGTWVCT